MSKQQEEDCPVSNELCVARMETLEEKLKAIKTAVYASAATLGIVLSMVELLLRYWRP